MRLQNPGDVGGLIRERRRALGLDQRTLAARVGVSRQWIVAAEKGKPRAALGLILRTLNALGVALRAGESPTTPFHPASPAAAVDIDRVVEAHRRRAGAKP